MSTSAIYLSIYIYIYIYNREYDDIKQLELDEEDTYFNEEDPSLVEQNNTRYTGEQDF